MHLLLRLHVDDYENQGRRKNIRLIALTEVKEMGSTMNDYIKKILGDGLGLQWDKYEIKSSYRNR